MTVPFRDFGRLVKRDPRDRKYLLKKVQGDTVLKDKSWLTGPVQDQLDTPACVGYGISAWFRSSPLRQDPIDPLGIYKIAKLIDNYPYEGTTVRDGIKVLEMTGHVKEYRWCWDLQTALIWLSNHGPLIVGTDWYSDMNTPNSDNYISPTGEFLGGHCYLVHRINVKKQYVALQNSWGLNYGLVGKAYLSFQGFEKLLKAEGECCAATEIKRG